MLYFQLLKGCTVTEDGDSADTYGVKVFDVDPKINSNSHICIYENCDITYTPEEMLYHINLWNELQPSIPHFLELIQDIIDKV